MTLVSGLSVIILKSFSIFLHSASALTPLEPEHYPGPGIQWGSRGRAPHNIIGEGGGERQAQAGPIRRGRLERMLHREKTWNGIEFDFSVSLTSNAFSITFTPVPPDILDYPTSSDMVVREGTNVSLQCAATGFPPPKIMWRREDKQKIAFDDHFGTGFNKKP